MKIKRFFAIALVLCLFLTGCSSSFNWDKSVSKLEDAGYTVTKNYTGGADLDRITHECNSDFKMHKKDYTVEVVIYMTLDKEKDTCFFLQFKTEEQAKNYYDLRVEMRSQFEDSKLKFALYKDVLLLTDSTEVTEILNLKFN